VTDLSLLGDGGVGRVRCMERICETDAEVLTIEDGVEFAQEWITEDEEWALWWWDIKGHQTDGALVGIHVTVNIIIRLELEHSVTNQETELWEGVVVGAIGGDIDLVDEGVDDVSWAGKEGCTSVNGDLAALTTAERLLGSVESDVIHGDLPVAGDGNISPSDLASVALLLVLTERDFGSLAIGSTEEDREEVVLKNLLLNHAIDKIEGITFTHLWQRKTEDTIEWDEGEWFIRLARGSNEITVSADIADADLLLNEDTTGLTGTESDGNNITITIWLDWGIWLICESDLNGTSVSRRFGRIVTLVRSARIIAALRRWEEEVATTSVENDEERLSTNRDLAVVLARVHHLGHHTRLSHGLAEAHVRWATLKRDGQRASSL